MLTKNYHEWIWNDKQEVVFIELNAKLANTSILERFILKELY